MSKWLKTSAGKRQDSLCLRVVSVVCVCGVCLWCVVSVVCGVCGVCLWCVSVVCVVVAVCVRCGVARSKRPLPRWFHVFFSLMFQALFEIK